MNLLMGRLTDCVNGINNYKYLTELIIYIEIDIIVKTFVIIQFKKLELGVNRLDYCWLNMI